MTAALFPAYGLARFVVSRPWAIAAAVGAVAAPPLAYAPYLLEEPLAYPFSTAALWAITAAIARPTRGRLALAAVFCLVAPFVRGELAVLAAIFGAGLFVLVWRSERFAALALGLEQRRLDRRRRTRPRRRDRRSAPQPATRRTPGTWRPAS